jgi:hypothetical protein
VRKIPASSALPSSRLVRIRCGFRLFSCGWVIVSATHAGFPIACRTLSRCPPSLRCLPFSGNPDASGFPRFRRGSGRGVALVAGVTAGVGLSELVMEL